MDPTRASWIRVTNAADREVRVYVEPWGYDFPIAPESWIEFEAEDAPSEFGFELCVDGDDRHHQGSSSFSLHHKGHCKAMVVSFPDGSRERFGWSVRT